MGKKVLREERIFRVCIDLVTVPVQVTGYTRGDCPLQAFLQASSVCESGATARLPCESW